MNGRVSPYLGVYCREGSGVGGNDGISIVGVALSTVSGNTGAPNHARHAFSYSTIVRPVADFSAESNRSPSLIFVMILPRTSRPYLSYRNATSDVAVSYQSTISC